MPLKIKYCHMYSFRETFKRYLYVSSCINKLGLQNADNKNVVERRLYGF